MRLRIRILRKSQYRDVQERLGMFHEMKHCIGFRNQTKDIEGHKGRYPQKILRLCRERKEMDLPNYHSQEIQGEKMQ